MKNNLLLTLVLVSLLCNANAQYNVSTEVQKKHVLIEEFTGIHCSYCPDAHRRVADLMKVQDNIHAIAFHAGSLAHPGPDEPDFRTDEGEEVYASIGGTGMPSGTVNRTSFDGSDNVVSPRTSWGAYAHELTMEDAPVNVWMQSTYDSETRKLTVDVELYYTADVDEETNNLVVVVTENNVMGPQRGGGVGDEYMHQHMARAFLTPVWGEEVACGKGTFVSKQYTYDVPEMYDVVEANPAEFEIVAFVTGDKTPVHNVTSVRPDYPGLELPLAAEIAPYRIGIEGTYGFNFYEAYMTNQSTETITSATFTITLNGEDYEVECDYDIAPRSTEYIRIPFSHEGLLKEEKNTYTVKLTGLNGEAYAGNKFNGRFNAPLASTTLNKFAFLTDTCADETQYLVKDADGNVVHEFGPYPAGQEMELDEWLQLEPNKTYCFEVADNWANGVTNGYCEVRDAYNNTVEFFDELYGHGYRTFFTTSQYNVSTVPDKRSLLIEEFTGIHCGNCPDGHHQIKELLKAQGDKIYVVAIHAGHYAVPFPGEPDFCTEVGDSIDSYLEVSRLAGYPSALLNRAYSEDGSELLHSRSIWASYGHTLTEQDAPVNLWVGSRYIEEEGKLYVNVEGYYTADVDAEANYLNVVITQDHIIGVQNGADNPNTYEHNHVARHYLTPVWGEAIESCKEGDFFTREYVYEVPTDINEVLTKPGDFEVIAFVCKDKYDVLNVTGTFPDYPGYEVPISSDVIKFTPYKIPVSGTYAYNYYDAYLENNSTEVIENAAFTITLNEVEYEASWTGSIDPGELGHMRISFDHSDLIMTVNDYEVRLDALNYVAIEGHSFSGDFQDPVVTSSTTKFIIKTDNYADENAFVIKDMYGKVVHEFGPYPVGVVTEAEEFVELQSEKTYCFEVTDSWANGILLPRGTVKMYNSEGKLVSQQLEIKDHGCRIFFTVVEQSALNSLDAENNLAVYYSNLLDAIVVESASQEGQVSIYNVAGTCIYNGTAATTLQVPVETAGVYVVKVVTPTTQQVVKVVAQ